jgi:ketosteroid isomerase-like protein
MEFRKHQVGLVLAAILFSVGCNSVPTPAPDTRAVDEAAIRKADADWVKAAQTRHPDAWVAFYSDDAVVLPPNDKTANIKESIHKIIADMFSMPNVVVTWEPTKVEVAKSGDVGYLYGTYQMTWDDSSGKQASDHGKNVEIWRKQADGSWKCAVDTWSSDLPAEPPPSK